MRDDFGRAVGRFPFVFLRERAECLPLGQRASSLIERKDSQRTKHLVDDVCRLGIRREGNVPRSAARGDLGFAMQRDRSSLGVELINQDLVQPQVADHREFVVRRDACIVDVRFFLALGVHARTGVLEERGLLGQAPIVANRKDGQAAAGVVRRQDQLARRIDTDVARRRAARDIRVDLLERVVVLAFERREPPGFLLCLEFIEFGDGVERLAIGMQRDIRRVLQLRGQLRFAELPVASSKVLR